MKTEEVVLDETGIYMKWNDGHRSHYPYRYLRGQCCCAGCVEEMTGRRRVGEQDVREDVYAADWMQIGRYAIQFLWSDTHYTGIYPFDVLRSLCQCEECQTKEVE